MLIIPFPLKGFLRKKVSKITSKHFYYFIQMIKVIFASFTRVFAISNKTSTKIYIISKFLLRHSFLYPEGRHPLNYVVFYLCHIFSFAKRGNFSQNNQSLMYAIRYLTSTEI